MNGYVATEHLKAAHAGATLAAENWERKVSPEQHKLISGNFLTTFSKDYKTHSRKPLPKPIPLSADEKRRLTPGNFLTRSRRFHRLVDWAFNVCDSRRKGAIGESELYAGLLLVHLNLAKWAGPAACFPPTRRTVNILFDTCDLDGSGGIDRYEFNIIAGVCCAQLLGRMLIYYGASIFVLPKLSQYVVEQFETVEPGGYAAKALEQVVSTFFFMMVIPLFWNKVDAGAAKEAKETSREIIQQHSFSGETRETALAVATVAATVAEYHRKTM